MVFIRSLLLLRFAQEWKGTDRFRGGRGPGSHRRRQRLHLQRLLLAAPSNLGWLPAQPEVIESPPSPTSCLRPPPHLPREPWSYPLASAENGTYRGGRGAGARPRLLSSAGGVAGRGSIRRPEMETATVERWSANQRVLSNSRKHPSPAQQALVARPHCGSIWRIPLARPHTCPPYGCSVQSLALWLHGCVGC